MLDVYQADSRGRSRFDWLDSRHTFSFGGYVDPERMGVSVLRVINDDRVAPGAGFAPHGHRDMEIVSYVLEGGIAHRDSSGGEGVLTPGEVQLMSAGTGITHSEFNASRDEPLHFLQIWIRPARPGSPPGYQQARFFHDGERGIKLVAAPDGLLGALRIHQDARLYIARLAAGEHIGLSLDSSRVGYLHLARGEVAIGGTRLGAGDGARLLRTADPLVTARADSELLFFDLP